ncbi:MAG: serine hydrolase [Gammaproteobacteria bacterium]|nr:serine hydrolase [Gammaproteobacteria bacterium]
MNKIQLILLAVIILMEGLCPSLAHAQVGSNGVYYPPEGETISYQSIKQPAEVGLSTTTVSALQSVITGGRWALWRHGYLVHIEGDFNSNTDVDAVSTGIHAATVGVAVERSLILSLDEKLSVWNSELTGIDADVTWRHVLSQTSALDDSAALPGTAWAYSDANAYQLNKALSRIWGRIDLTDNYDAVLADALFDPIGAQGWSSSVAADGINLHMDLEDMGRIGTLLIAGGVWVNNRILPEWVLDLMVTRQSDSIPAIYNNANGGITGLQVVDFPESPYGLMTWVNTDQILYPEADATWAVVLGAASHLIAVNPANGIVLAVEDGSFSPVQGNPPGWPTVVRSAIETIQQQVVGANPLVPESDYNVSNDNNAVKAFPGTSWEFKQPEEVGMDSTKLDSLQSAIGGNGPGIVIKDGYYVYSWGNQADHGDWASASKAMFSTLLFFAINEGRLNSVDDLIIDQSWALDLPDQGMKFRHLANMTSGYSLPDVPGTNWAYNDYGVKLYVLTILNKVFGINATSGAEIDALVADNTRLGPLQFEDGALFSNQQRVTMTPRDYARIGWFWANRGEWNGQVILPQNYFDDYMQTGVPDTLPQTQGTGTSDYLGIGSYGGGNNQTVQGPGKFGFMWWFNPAGQTWPDAPNDTFQVNGMWNRDVMTVIPSLGIVAAWRGGSVSGSDTFNVPMNTIIDKLVDATTVDKPSRWGVPSVPLNARASNSDSQINLEWEDNPEADLAGYFVYRSETRGSLFSNVSGLVSESSYIDNGLQNGKQYYYVIKAEDVAGQHSPVSPEVIAVPQVGTLPTAHWRLNEDGGLNVMDSIGPSDGIVVGSTWVAGVSGSALDFDGAGDHVAIHNTPELDIKGTQLTLSAWLYPHDGGTSGGSRIISKRTNAGGSDTFAMYTQNNRIRFRINGQDMISDYSFTLNQWLHVTMVYDGVDKRIYVNGILDTALPQPKTDPIDMSIRRVHLGMREGEIRYFNGLLDDIRIYDTALTAVEIAGMDQDEDGLTDYLEVSMGTNFSLSDTDDDGLSDYDEVNRDGDPTSYTPGLDTDPLLFDTDVDGYSDGEEITAGSDPLDDTSVPIVADGDINDDGQVDVADLLLAIRILMGAYSPSAEEQARWDVAPLVNGVPEPDSQNTLGDFVVLQQKVLGLINF